MLGKGLVNFVCAQCNETFHYIDLIFEVADKEIRFTISFIKF